VTDDPLLRLESLGYLTNHLARLFAHALAERIGEHGVSPGQFAQLLALYEQDGLTQRELCERVRIEQATMAKTLQRMERDGLVRSEPDPVDRRRIRVYLTEKARRLKPRLTAAGHAVNDDATAGLTAKDVEIYRGLVQRLIANLEAAGAS
jgi:DNA-binding MarR family transcriptional regulator